MQVRQVRLSHYQKNQTHWDQEKVISLIWRHQETLRKGPISEELLHRQTGWGNWRFRNTLYSLLSDSEKGVYRTKFDKIAYRW